MSNSGQITIVGGGFAAISAVETLRGEGFEGRILMLSEEHELPYDRPPLSKEYLSGESSLQDIVFFDEAWYRDRQVDFELSQKVTTLDVASQTVSNASGKTFHYNQLLLVPGARPRPIHGPFENAGVPLSYLRSRQDADAIRERAKTGARFVLVGGGVIGMELAATLKNLGCEVTVLEMAERIMARFLPSEMSDMLTQLHRERGVNVLTHAVVDSVKRAGAEGASIHLQSGERIEADYVVVGVGIVPNAELAENAGLPIRLQGIEVDPQGRTAADNIFAAGDVAAFEIAGTWTRWENWTHARHQAQVAAKAMLGQDVQYWDVPWVWSHQHEFNIQVTGNPHGEELVFRGDIADGKLLAFHLKNRRLVGATTFNNSKDKRYLRSIIEARAVVDPEVLRDKSVKIKELAKQLGVA